MSLQKDGIFQKEIDLQRSRLASKSVVYRKSMCQNNDTKLDLQVSMYKERAHKSFLQVMQMEHLHQQQIEQLKAQFEERQKNNQKMINELQQKIYNVQNQLKISNKYIMDLSNSFTIDNIEQIQCKQSIDGSQINQSSILQIKQILTFKDNKWAQSLQDFKNEIFKDLKISPMSKINEYEKKIVRNIQKLFRLAMQLTDENINLRAKIEESTNSFCRLETQFKSLKIQYQSSTKQVKFLSEHIKRILTQKNVLERKYNQLERNKKALQENIKCFKNNKGENGHNDFKGILNSNENLIANKVRHSCQLSGKNHEMGISNEAKLKLGPENNKLIGKLNELKGSMEIKSVKGLRISKEILGKNQSNY